MHILIINFNNSAYTISCIKSLFKSTYTDFHIYVLDNRSDKDELTEIKQHFNSNKISYYRSKNNLGFAGGNNFLFEKVIPNASLLDKVLLLNNDTEVDHKMLEILSKNSNPILTPKMMQMDNPSEIDNLGLTMKLSGLALNRKSKDQTLFGPSGGCAVFTVKCLQEIRKKTGDYFDEDYFCYAEDTDLAWRAQLIGYRPTYIDTAICYHKGGATTGGSFNKFVMYHTFRNTLYNLAKNASLTQLILQSPWIIGFQLAVVLRYLFTGKASTLLKIHQDFIRHLPTLLKKRKFIKQAVPKGHRPNN